MVKHISLLRQFDLMWGFIAILYHEYVTMFPPFRSSLQYITITAPLSYS
jgi:hypothetical protein